MSHLQEFIIIYTRVSYSSTAQPLFNTTDGLSSQMIDSCVYVCGPYGILTETGV